MINIADFRSQPDLLQKSETIFTTEAVAFINDLVRKFSVEVKGLLGMRRMEQKVFDTGVLPDFAEHTAHIRNSDWAVAPIPADLLDRRVEITGPAERKMIINALNSGANVFMADLEDSNSPTWMNILQAQVNLMDAVRKTISFTNETGKEYKLNDKTAVLMVRPRGWHMLEKHFEVDGEAVPAALFDFGLYFFHNAKELMARGTAPYFYLPKLESHFEARLWNDVFVYAQEKLQIPVGTIRATCLIETITAAFEMDEILWELKDHSAGLNAGRWDYIFSFIKKFAKNPNFILPDRSQVTMDKAFLDAYSRLLIQTCHKRGVHAMGGMAAQIPIKNDPVANEAAMAKVRADKLREVKLGHDGTWVAHPGLVSIAREIFDQYMPQANQIVSTVRPSLPYHTIRHRTQDDPVATYNKDIDVSACGVITQQDLLEVHQGTRTETGLRHNIRVGIQYLEAWLRGVGCVPIYNLMEDAATAELSRAQVWQWLHHGAPIDGHVISIHRFHEITSEEMRQIEREVGATRFSTGKFQQAHELFLQLSVAPSFKDFLTLTAYELID
jgi:malate synthase